MEDQTDALGHRSTRNRVSVDTMAGMLRAGDVVYLTAGRGHNGHIRNDTRDVSRRW
jgi:hypothetical protein